MIAIPQVKPALPITGGAGRGTTALTTDAGALTQPPEVVTAVYVPLVCMYRYEFVLPSSSHKIPDPPLPGMAVTLDDSSSQYVPPPPITGGATNGGAPVMVTDTDAVPLVQPSAEVVTAVYVLLRVTLDGSRRGDTVLPLSVHRIPLPPLPGVAVITAIPQFEPVLPITGAAGTGFMITSTEAASLTQSDDEVDMA
jgi:hypothetical protein